MSMAELILAADCILVVVPGIAAYSGFMFRAAWAAMMVVSMAVAAVLGSLEQYHFIGRGNSLSASEVMANQASVIAAAFASVALGSLLAVCLYRPKKAARQSHTPGSLLSKTS